MVSHNAQLLLQPIGFVRSPHAERHSAPRQPAAARDVRAAITLVNRTGYEHALADIQAWSHLWVVFWFHLNPEFRARVAPPRSARKRGVFATRAPYRPNPIGLSLVRLERIEGRTLYIRDVDMLDGTPVLDIKPYVPYADVAVDANHGWLPEAADPAPRYRVRFGPRADAQLTWLATHGVDWLRARAEGALALGPAPHPYRRIKPDGDHMRIAIKDFRLRFTTQDLEIEVQSVHSGYRRRDLADPAGAAKDTTPLAVHRAFVSRFGP